MKIATTVITILSIATALVSCQKDKNPAVNPLTVNTGTQSVSNKPSGGIPPVQTGRVSYMMSTTASGQSDIIKWRTGYINVYTVGFEGNVQIGQSMEKRKFTTGVGESRALFNPFQLNAVNVAYENYSEPLFRVSLNPYGTYSLYLTGTTVRRMSVGKDAGPARYAALQVMPVQFSINDAIDLTTPYTPIININYGGYGARLFLDPTKLLRRVNQDMIDNAEVSDGVIVISNSSNQEIYKWMIQNINSVLSVDFSQAASPSPL